MSTTHPWYKRTGTHVALAALAVPLVAAGTSAAVGAAAHADPLDSQITSEPGGYTTDNTPSFAGVTDPGATIQVELDSSGTLVDAGTADASTGQWQYEIPSALPDGPHQVRFRFADTADKFSYFAIDTVAPEQPTWKTAPDTVEGGDFFSVNDSSEPVSWDFALDRDPWVNQWGTSYAVNVSDGTHLLRARSVDQAGNVSPEIVKRFTNTSAATAIQLVSAPDPLSTDAEPTFVFTDDFATSWEYTLNGNGPIPFTDGTVTLPPLTSGDYFIEVSSVDQNGTNTYTYPWTLEVPPSVAPVVSLVTGPSSSTVEQTATFEFTADKDVTAWTYSLDGAAPVAFSNGSFTLTSVTVGSHTVVVNATDADGNVSADVTVAWTVTNGPTDDPTDDPTGGTGTTVAPQSVKQGGRVTVEDAGWEPGAQISVSLDGTLLVTSTVDPDGFLRTTFGVSLDTTVGEHVVKFVAATLTKTMALTVTSGDTEPPLAVDPQTPPTVDQLGDPVTELHGEKVKAGASVQFSASGFTAGEVVQVWMLSTPQLLSSVNATDVGLAAGEALLPTTLPSGQHHLVLRGLTSGHLEYKALVVEDAPAADTSATDGGTTSASGGSLPVTGANSAALAGVAAGLVTAGVAAALIGRRRKRQV